jgi:hypothetical protein
MKEEIEEIWKTIEDYPDYMISNMGRVKSLKYGKERIIKQLKNKDGYWRVILCKEGKTKQYYIHRLVAMNFIPNPNNLPIINHKDENPSNNCVSNVEWCSYTYNINYGKRNEKVAKAHKGKPNISVSKPILQFSKSGNIILGKFNSLSQVSKLLNINCSDICNCCNGKRKSAKGYKWMYYEDYVNRMNRYLTDKKVS